MNIQAPPNLQPEGLAQLIRAGINDWGGVSPVTPDHVNPEAPWPHLRDLELATERAGRTLVERLAIYPEYIPVIPEFRGSEISGTQGKKRPALKAPGSRLSALSRSGRDDNWLAPALHTPLLRLRDSAGFAREDGWSPGADEPLPTRAGCAHRDPAQRHRATIARIAGSRRRGRGSFGGGDRRAVRSARAGFLGRVSCRRPAARGARRRRRHLCRQPQHQLHEHLHLRLQVLRLLEGAAQLRVAREALRSEFRRNLAAHARGLAARRDRSVPAGRHPAGLHGRNLSVGRPGGEVRGARHPCARLLAAGNLARRDHARAAAARLSGEAQGGRTGEPSGHRRRNPG